MLKKVLKDILYGVLIIFVVMICELLVTLPFGSPPEAGALKGFLNLEFALSAIPALLVTFGFAALLKTVEFGDAIRRSGVWTGLLVVNYLIVGFGNATAADIFLGFGIYLLLVCAFVGPLLWWRIKKQKV